VTEVIQVALRVAEAIEACGLRYVVGGSLASSFAGEPRSTSVGAGPCAAAPRVPLVLTPAWGPRGPKPALRLAGAAPKSLPGGGPPCGISQPFAPVLPAGKAARPPRLDVNLAIELAGADVAGLAARLGPEFYLDADQARQAVRLGSSVNAIHEPSGIKVDFFVAHSALDRLQLNRRLRVRVGSNPERSLYVYTAEDILWLARAPARLPGHGCSSAGPVRRASRLCSRQLGGPTAPSRRCASQGPRRIHFPGAGRPPEFRGLSRRFCPQAKRRNPRELQKLLWYRLGGEASERQWRDGLGIVRTQGAALDRAYLERETAAIQAVDLLRRALAEVAGEADREPRIRPALVGAGPCAAARPGWRSAGPVRRASRLGAAPL